MLQKYMYCRKPNLEQKFTLLNAYITYILFLDPTTPPWLSFSHIFSSTIFPSFISVGPLIPLPAHLPIPTLTCFSKIPLFSSLVSLILLSLSFSSPPLQPAGATSPVWCESHRTAIPWLHTDLYMSAWLLLGRRIRAQDLQVRWELDRETTCLCRYNSYITSIKGTWRNTWCKDMDTHSLFPLSLWLHFYNITYLTTHRSSSDLLVWEQKHMHAGTNTHIDTFNKPHKNADVCTWPPTFPGKRTNVLNT